MDSKDPGECANTPGAWTTLVEADVADRIRTCADCGATPDAAKFVRDKRTPDGLGPRCLPCNRVKQRETYERHAVSRNARTRAHYAANRDAVLAQQREYREQNAEQIRAYDRNRSKLPERQAAQRERRMSDPERWTTYQREWFRAHPDESLRYRTQWRLTQHGFPELAETAELVSIETLHARHNGRCGICGDPVARNELTIDHIKPLHLGGPHTEGNCQPAHRDCNSAKGRRDDSWACSTSSAALSSSTRPLNPPSP